MAYELDRRFPFLAPQGRLHVVSFGAPRVGNAAFCQDFDSRLRDVTFRVVNGLDVVARFVGDDVKRLGAGWIASMVTYVCMCVCSIHIIRMPRGTKQPNVLEYAHCGKTVLLTGGGEPDGRFSVWVEGESEGTCPLLEADPFARAAVSSPTTSSASSASSDSSDSSSSGPSNFEFQMPVSLGMVNGTAASVQDMLRAASNWTNLQAMLSPAASAASTGPFSALSLQTDFDQLKGAILSGALNGTGLAAKSILGLSDTFVDAELRMMESLILGDALAQHMEPSYFITLGKAFAMMEEEGAQQEEEEAAG